MSRLEVTAVVGEYKNAQGETKKRYIKVGSAWDKGQYTSVKLDAIPAGNEWNGWLTIQAPLEKTERQEKPQRHSAPVDDSDVPF